MTTGTPTGMAIAEIWRYPVKSMGGERLASTEVGPLGIDGDRRWGVVDVETGRVLTARRVPELLMARARHLGPGRVEITLPDGTATTSDADLSAWLARPVALVPSEPAAVPSGVAATDGPDVLAGAAFPMPDGPRFEVPDPDEQDWGVFPAADGAWHDSARTRLSLVSRATVGGWDPRRFRSNVLLDGGGEDDLVDATLALGTVTLEISKRVARCVMVNRPLPGEPADRSVLRTILDERSGTLAIGARILAPGHLAEGDRLLRLPG